MYIYVIILQLYTHIVSHILWPIKFSFPRIFRSGCFTDAPSPRSPWNARPRPGQEESQCQCKSLKSINFWGNSYGGFHINGDTPSSLVSWFPWENPRKWMIFYMIPYGSSRIFWKEVRLGCDDWGVSCTFSDSGHGSIGINFWGESVASEILRDSVGDQELTTCIVVFFLEYFIRDSHMIHMDMDMDDH